MKIVSAVVFAIAIALPTLGSVARADSNSHKQPKAATNPQKAKPATGGGESFYWYMLGAPNNGYTWDEAYDLILHAVTGSCSAIAVVNPAAHPDLPFGQTRSLWLSLSKDGYTGLGELRIPAGAELVAEGDPHCYVLLEGKYTPTMIPEFRPAPARSKGK